MKHAQACLSARKDRESSFHHRGGPVSTVQACLCARNILERRFDRRRGAMKQVQARSSASTDGENSFHYFEVLYSWCKPVYGQETPFNAI